MESMIKRLEKLDLPEPKPLCWVIINGENYYELYCPSCADKVVDYCLNGFNDEDGYFDEKWLLPSKEEYGDVADAYYIECRDMVGDGVEICQGCWAHLMIILTGCGVESELDHFERIEAIETKQELREIYDIFWAIEYSHGEDCEYYDRAIKLIEKIKPFVTRLEQSTTKKQQELL